MTMQLPTPAPRKIAAIILAAGLGSRYRAADPSIASKVLAHVNGEAMVRTAVRAALAASCSPVLVVTGHAAEEVDAAVRDLNHVSIHNSDYREGLSSSLRAGVGALPADVDAAFILLADMPRVDAALLQLMMDRFAQEPDADALIPVHEGLRGNPVLLTRAMFARVAQLKGDEGARKLLREDGLKIVEIQADARALVDVDTPDALGGGV